MVSFHLGTHSAASSRPPSRPSSRPASPTAPTARRAAPTHISLPSSADLTEGLSDYFGGPSPSTPVYPHPPGTPGYGAAAQTPAYGPYGSYGSEGLAAGAFTPGGGGYFQPHGPVEILLDSDRLVMRGAGGDMNPAYLSGQVELNLADTTNIKEIHMSLHGKAKVSFSDGSGTAAKSHHSTHPVLVHDWSFLEGNKKSHTLKQGRHTFNFSLMLNGNLPMTMQTYHGDAVIYYKLRAVVVRAGFASNYQTIKTFTLLRMFSNEALEFNQTLEIENTWPGKVMYSLTLPFKAYAAGDDIPVNVKFMPLAKGVRVTSVSSVIKEYSLVHTRHSSHADQRVASSVKHEFRHGTAILASTEPARPPAHWTDSRDSSRVHSYSSIPAALQYASPYAAAGPSGHADDNDNEASEENIEIGDDEVNTFFSIPIPPWTTPSHGIHPVFVTHKIKWSCSISNPDGHVSELRCALPIIILDHSLLEEARASSINTRNLLYGTAADDASANVDLPSYSNHVYDRIAIADAAGSGAYSAARSAATTPVNSPPVSRGPSRPGSPTGHRADELGGSWADAELLRSLGALNLPSQGSSPHSTPPTSNGPSRQLSRHNSRSGRSSRINSRPTSRASSPDRSSRFSITPTDTERPGERRHAGGLSGLLHIPVLKRQTGGASKGIMRNNASSETMTRPMSFTNLASARNVSFANEPPVRRTNFSIGEPEYDDEDEVQAVTDPINRVPSYNIAARGFLGGGVVPIDSGLPTYDASETQAVPARPRSDTALVELGAQAAADAEERAEAS